MAGGIKTIKRDVCNASWRVARSGMASSAWHNGSYGVARRGAGRRGIAQQRRYRLRPNIIWHGETGGIIGPLVAAVAAWQQRKTQHGINK